VRYALSDHHADGYPCLPCRFKVIPLWVVRIAIWVLGLLARVWDGAARVRAFVRFLLIVSQYDAVGECCGSRRLADYFQELAAKGGTGSEGEGIGAPHRGNGSAQAGTAVGKKRR
jgi:hypothetical protein